MNYVRCDGSVCGVVCGDVCRPVCGDGITLWFIKACPIRSMLIFGNYFFHRSTPEENSLLLRYHRKSTEFESSLHIF